MPIKTAARRVLVALCVGFLVWLVWRTGPRELLASVGSRFIALPIFIGFELGIALCDLAAYRELLGIETPLSRWVYARAVAYVYATPLVLPGGRTTQEAARVGVMAPHVGLVRATAASVNLVVVYSGAGAIAASVFTVLSVRKLGFNHVLSRGVFITALGGAAICASILIARAFAHRTRLRTEVRPGFRGKLDVWLNQYRASGLPTRRAQAQSLGYCLIGRALEATSYTMLAWIVIDDIEIYRAVLAYSVQLVGASAGEMVPGQVGVLEGAFELAAGALGLAASDARVLTIPLLARLSRLFLGACFGVLLLLTRSSLPHSSEGALGESSPRPDVADRSVP